MGGVPDRPAALRRSNELRLGSPAAAQQVGGLVSHQVPTPSAPRGESTMSVPWRKARRAPPDTAADKSRPALPCVCQQLTSSALHLPCPPDSSAHRASCLEISAKSFVGGAGDTVASSEVSSPQGVSNTEKWVPALYKAAHPRRAVSLVVSHAPHTLDDRATHPPCLA